MYWDHHLFDRYVFKIIYILKMNEIHIVSDNCNSLTGKTFNLIKKTKNLTTIESWLEDDMDDIHVLKWQWLQRLTNCRIYWNDVQEREKQTNKQKKTNSIQFDWFLIDYLHISQLDNNIQSKELYLNWNWIIQIQ